MKHLESLLSTSTAESSLHHLHIVSGPVGPLGMPDPEKLQVTIYAIAPDETVNAGRFICKTIAAAAVNSAQADHVIVFAGLSQEVWAVVDTDTPELVQDLVRQGRLREHPDAIDVTMVYAACRDGRRWTGRRYLSGPRANTTDDVKLLVGPPDHTEASRPAKMVRSLVGMTE